jgi:DNA-binding transcriptional MerR regulator
MKACSDGLQCQIPAKLYRIGELVRHTPFSRQTIHNYTTMGLIHESEWTTGGHRLYDESVFRRLSRIIELKQSKSLSEIRHILRNEDETRHVTRDGSFSRMLQKGEDDSVQAVT